MIPLMVRLAGLRVVVVGGGEVAARKVTTLLDEGAEIVVCSPEAVPALAAAAEEGRIVWQRRPYRSGDAADARLVVAATADPGVNARVAADAEAAGAWCVRADGGGSANLAAAVRRGPLTLAVATDGGAPALSRKLRQELEASYGEEYGALALLLADLRRDAGIQRVLRGFPPSERRAKWRSVLDTDILDLLRNGQVAAAREVAIACLSSSSD